MKLAAPHRPLQTVRYVWLGVLLCALVGALCFFGGRLSVNGRSAPQLDAVVVRQQLSAISELASVTYSYTNMAQFQSSNDFYGMKLPFTTKSFILTYDGTIKAGIDLRAVAVSVEGDQVRVNLPESKILSHQLEEDSVEVFDEKTSIFNPFTVEDFTAFQADQKAVMEEKALARGLLAEAGEKAALSVETLLRGALPAEYVLTVE